MEGIHMRLARKLLLLAATALTALAMTALAMTAGAASAKIEFLNEATGTHCGTVTVVGHHVEGGCHVGFASPPGTDIPLHAYIPDKLTIGNCEWSIEGQIDTNGVGYVTDAVLSSPHSGSVPCTRAACDEAEPSHEMLPWPVQFHEQGPGDEVLEGTFCLRDSSAAEGTTGAECEVHLELTDFGNHQYELGHATEVFCENNLPNRTTHPTLSFPVSIEPHLVSGEETLEIPH
jgi:hypothetical protein